MSALPKQVLPQWFQSRWTRSWFSVSSSADVSEEVEEVPALMIRVSPISMESVMLGFNSITHRQKDQTCWQYPKEYHLPVRYRSVLSGQCWRSIPILLFLQSVLAENQKGCFRKKYLQKSFCRNDQSFTNQHGLAKPQDLMQSAHRQKGQTYWQYPKGYRLPEWYRSVQQIPRQLVCLLQKESLPVLAEKIQKILSDQKG